MIELAVPFRVGPDGSIATVSDPNVIVRQHVLSLVGTQRGERVMRPNYGVNIQRFLFASNDTTLGTLLQQEISSALQQWEPDATFQGATIDTGATQENIAKLTVKYRNTTTNQPSQALTVNVNAPGQ